MARDKSLHQLFFLRVMWQQIAHSCWDILTRPKRSKLYILPIFEFASRRLQRLGNGGPWFRIVWSCHGRCKHVHLVEIITTVRLPNLHINLLGQFWNMQAPKAASRYYFPALLPSVITSPTMLSAKSTAKKGAMAVLRTSSIFADFCTILGRLVS